MRKLLSLLAMMICFAHVQASFAQNVEGQIIAAQYGTWQVPGTSPNTYAFTPTSCRVQGGSSFFFAFTPGTPVKVVDANPSLTEVVTPTATIDTNVTCAVSIAPLNAHQTPFYITSATGGLQEAINQNLTTPAMNTIVLTNQWYQQVANAAATIASVQGSASLGLVDVTTVPTTWYRWNGTQYVRVAPSGTAGSLGTLQNDLLGNNLGNTAAVDFYDLFATSAVNSATTINPQTAITGAVANSGAVVLQPGTVGIPFTNTSHVFVLDQRMASPAFAWPLTSSGAVCDAQSVAGQFSSSSNLITGYTFSQSDVGKTIMAVAPNGSGLPTRYIGVIQSVNSSNQAVMVGNSPFSTGANWVFTLAHDDQAAETDALNFAANTGIAISLPANYCFSSLSQAYLGQSIYGQGENISGLIGPAGQDTLYLPDVSTGGSGGTGGGHLHDFTVFFDDEIDAADNAVANSAALWSACTSSGCNNVAGLYRPLGIGDAVANNPINAQWIQGTGPYNTGAINGVATTTTSSAVICVPTSETKPAIGSVIIFPYQAATVPMFQTTVASYAGSCGSGNPVTLAAAYTPAGATAGAPSTEWFAGTTFQTITTAIPASGRTWPMTINLSKSIIPDPEFARAGFAPYGVLQIDAEQFTYFKTSNVSANTSGTYSVTLTSSIQNGTGATGPLHSTSAVPFPLNPINPALPWPVTPTLTANQTTPTGAEFYPAVSVGNAGISAAVANGTNYSGGSTLAQATWENLRIFPWPLNVQSNQNPIGYQVQNSTAGIYLVPLPFNSTFSNIEIVNSYFGIAEGTPSTNTHGYFINGQPTADGNKWSHITVHSACYDLWLIGEGSSTWEGPQTFSQCGQPPNHLWPQFVPAYSGAQGSLYMGGPYDDQTAPMNFNSINLVDTHWSGFYVEAESSGNPNLVLTAPLFQLDCTNCKYTSWTPKSGGLTYVGGSSQIFQGGALSAGPSNPIINYGQSNTFDKVAQMVQTGTGNSNVWGVGSFLNWGPQTNASALANGIYGTNVLAVSGNSARTPTGQTGDTFWSGNIAASFVDPVQGYIRPDEFNSSNSLESQPMTQGWVFDDTAPLSHSYVSCSVNAGYGNACYTYQFNTGARVNIGPEQRIPAGPTVMQTAFKTPSGAGTFAFTLSSFNAGGGGAGCGVAYTGTVTTTGTGWTLFPAQGATPIIADFTGQAGCALVVTLGGNGGSAQPVQMAFLDLTPKIANLTATTINVININAPPGTTGGGPTGCAQSPVTGISGGFSCPTKGIQTSLASNQGISDTTLVVTSASGLSASGCFFVDAEYECYTGITSNTLTGVTRAAYTTTATTHTTGANVVLVSLVLGSVQQAPSTVVAYGASEPQIFAVNDPYPFNHGGLNVFSIDSGANETWFDTGGAIHQTNSSVSNAMYGSLQIGSIPNEPSIGQSGYVLQTNGANTAYSPLTLGGGHAGTLNVIKTPTLAAPTVNNYAGSGSTTISYVCSGTDFDGNLVNGTTTSITNGPSSWAFPAFFQVVCPWSAGVNTYQIYRTVGGVNQGLIGSGTGAGFSTNDFNGSSSGGTPPGSNASNPKITVAGTGIPSIQLGTTNISTGTGAPASTCGTAPIGSGSLWLRTDGGASTSLYSCAGTTWTAVTIP